MAGVRPGAAAVIGSLATEVVLDPEHDPIRRSAVNLASIENMSGVMLVDRIGRLRDARMSEVCAALEVAVDCST